MQFKLLNLATGLLAVTSVQALVIPTSQASTTGVTTSLNNLLAQITSSNNVISKLKSGNSLTTGFTVLGEVTKLVASLTTASTTLGNAPTTTDTTTQEKVCALVKKVTDSATALLTTLNAKLSSLVGGLLAAPLQIVVDLLGTAFSSLQTQVQINSPSCASESDDSFEVISTLLNTLTLTK
ncbi:hypothetical protein EDB81DRAFT_886456 [Dactylonectria macrodidyma]|uniref:Uncharacterized protein n=1 Tax=Dactylonectria macrodidyma TaxID=307937 RepID=A0A9P9EF62_9HYPO|nr:hypothetical protein EDB81DRAFT_886456 [Dactylonectria macrodidyma]